VLISFGPASVGGGLRGRWTTCGEELAHCGDVDRTRQAQGPGERSAPLRELETRWIGMHPRTPATEPVVRIGHGERCVAGPHRDHSQEDGPARTNPAPDAGAYRPLRGPVLRRRLPGRLTGHHQSSAPGGL